MNWSEEEYQTEFASYGETLRPYYPAWRLSMILWKSVWSCSETDWGRYRSSIWSRFPQWVASAARRSRDLTGFLSLFARQAHLSTIGANEEEREALASLLALPKLDQDLIIRQLRNDAVLITALVRRFQSARKLEREKQNGTD